MSDKLMVIKIYNAGREVESLFFSFRLTTGPILKIKLED